jgi:hypothetical protein
MQTHPHKPSAPLLPPLLPLLVPAQDQYMNPPHPLFYQCRWLAMTLLRCFSRRASANWGAIGNSMPNLSQSMFLGSCACFFLAGGGGSLVRGTSEDDEMMKLEWEPN